MINEIKRSINHNNNKSEDFLMCKESYLKTFMKYAYFNVCFDSQSLTEGPTDVVYDGYDSLTNKLIVHY